MRSTLALFALAGLALIAPTARGQEAKPAAPAAAAPQEGLPAAEELFAKHVAAVGGEEALRAEKNRVTKAQVTVVGQIVSGTLTVQRIAPNKMYYLLDFPGVVTIETWFDGENGWVRNSNSGTQRLQGDALVQARRDADFLGEANYKKAYKELKTLERTTFADRPAYAVEATAPEGGKRVLYFDAERAFLIGAKVADAGVERTTVFGDYKKFGAAQHATKTTQKDGRSEIVTTVVSIDANVPTLTSVDPPEEVRNVK